MGYPHSEVLVPPLVARIAAGRPTHAVWRNELGGVTFCITSADGSGEFVKTGPGDFLAEAHRMNWARRFCAVPRVLGVDIGYLHTAGLPGCSAVDPRWADAAMTAARGIGTGLRLLHDRLPVSDCPFDWSVKSRLARIPAGLRATLGPAPAIDRLVVCHGDACAPNTLLDDDGRFCGHVDLGSLGVADRWADLAVATMSLDWNYPSADESFQDVLLEAYGIEPDAVRIDYYRRLWNAPEGSGG